MKELEIVALPKEAEEGVEALLHYIGKCYYTLKSFVADTPSPKCLYMNIMYIILVMAMLGEEKKFYGTYEAARLLVLLNSFRWLP